jgi:peptide/nickel transport system ATP-binding protein
VRSLGPESPALLDVVDLRVGTGGGALLSGVSLSCGHAERVAVVGASGSGKSLTAKALLGVLPAGLRATGSVRISGTEVLGVPSARRARHLRPGAVLQDSMLALHPLVKVGDQVALPLRRGSGRAQAHRAVLELLTAVGLADAEDAAHRYPAQLSGGQRQRVCLALALACRPALLVADEPTTALDVVTQAGIVQLLRERTGPPHGPALVFITHDLALAAALCTRLVVMHAGRVVEDGPALEVLRAPEHPRTRELVDAARRSSASLPVPS